MNFKDAEKEAKAKHIERMKQQSKENKQKMSDLKSKLKDINVPQKGLDRENVETT